MLATSSQTIPFVIHQHVEESAILRNIGSIKGVRFKLILKLQLSRALAGAAQFARERTIECGIICVTFLVAILIRVCPC